MGLFERYLSLWIALAIVVGVVLGGLLPDLAAWIASLEVARINPPIAVLIWGMIVPMMLAVDFSAIGGMREQPRGLLITVAMNWLIKPLTMTALAWVFIRGVFAAWIPDAMGQEYVAGMILIGITHHAHNHKFRIQTRQLRLRGSVRTRSLSCIG